MSMRIVAKVERVEELKSGEAQVVLRVENLRHAKMAAELVTNERMGVEIAPIKSKRSAEQNRLLWALLHEIDEAVNGEGSNGEWELYCECLEKAGAKFEYLLCRTEAEGMLRHYFRAIRYAMPAEDGMAWYKCYYGSSRMNSKEMTVLIDAVLDLAADAGIETAYWRSVLR